MEDRQLFMIEIKNVSKRFDNILAFYEQFLNNLFITFGIVAVVKEKEQVIENVSQIINSLEFKIDEMQSFIEMNSINH